MAYAKILLVTGAGRRDSPERDDARSNFGLEGWMESLRWVAGADALGTVEQQAKDLLAQLDANRELAHDDAAASV
jgi:hypothetical protein